MQASILVAVIHTAPPCRPKRRRFAPLTSVRHLLRPRSTRPRSCSRLTRLIPRLILPPLPARYLVCRFCFRFVLLCTFALDLSLSPFLSFSSFSLFFFFLVVQLLCFTRRLTSSTSMERSRSNDTKQKEETYSVRCMKPFIDFLTNCRLSRGELYILNSDHWM